MKIRLRTEILPDGNIGINLPTYAMLGPIGLDGYVDAEVPDADCDQHGPCIARIRVRYRGQPRWDCADLRLPAQRTVR